MQKNFSLIQPNQGIMSSSKKVLKKLMESMMLKSLALLRSVKLTHLLTITVCLLFLARVKQTEQHDSRKKTKWYLCSANEN